MILLIFLWRWLRQCLAMLWPTLRLYQGPSSHYRTPNVTTKTASIRCRTKPHWVKQAVIRLKEKEDRSPPASSHSNISLNAGSDVLMGAVEIKHASSVELGSFSASRDRTTYQVVDISDGGNLSIGAGRDITGDSERSHELSALIEQLQLGERVTLLGNLSDSELDQRLRASDCLCLPSIERTEAFGVALLGKACVVTAVPGTGMSWVGQHDHTGLVVPPNDTEVLAGALARLAANRAVCKAMGEAGLARFREEFTIDASAAMMADIYSELTESGAN